MLLDQLPRGELVQPDDLLRMLVQEAWLISW